ncbi:prenylated Rab acceptor protein 1-like [Eriocheir sinensis]|uniref:prenylated Rab acceptor protein 1-like n=1 Tax=Eriocheir sinensis TaxID=95602 RepID=UPI0021C6331D|nr:prenylated Rab acceptor protein 1-like [Eriocheir sinensis]
MSGGSGGDVEIDISGEIDVPEKLRDPSKAGFMMQLPMQLQLASPAAREWVTRQRENVRPWMVFFNTQKFKAPPSVQRWSKRLAKNVDYFQSNYMFVFVVLILYCLITSPLLLLAVAASLGACYILSLRNAEKKIIVGGHEVSLAHQFAAVGVFSLPVFYIAGAGAVLFWVLGASLFIIMVHASLYNIESLLGSDEEPFELEMEQV